MKMFVCTTCTPDGGFVEIARAGLPNLEIMPVDCMSGCTHAQTVAFRQEGKVAYLFGDITAQDFDDITTFAQLYAASDDGTFADARVLGNLRTKALARIPG